MVYVKSEVYTTYVSHMILMIVMIVMDMEIECKTRETGQTNHCDHI